VHSTPAASRAATTADKAWLQAAGSSEGPLFRPVAKGGRLGAERLTDQSVCKVVKAYAERIGLKATDFGAHCFRDGKAKPGDIRPVAQRECLEEPVAHPPIQAFATSTCRGSLLVASECVDQFFFRRGVEKMPVAHKQRRQIGLSAQSGVANLIILRGHSQKLSYLRVRRPTRVFHHQPANRQADWRRGAADAARAHRRGDQLIAARDMAASDVRFDQQRTWAEL
jgi:hypothetical protein